LFAKIPALLKQGLFLLLFILILGQLSTAQAQTTAASLESLAVDIWPDYDRPSVLILLTGVLPAGVSLPATVSLPVPDNGELTAVARISADGTLFSDIDFDESVPGEVRLTTPDPRFRVEYYFPYTLEGEERTFTFEWLADVSVSEMLVSVQQPVGTADMATDPAVFSVTTRQDGFQYHNLSPREVAAGERLSLAVSYSRSVSQLSAALLEPELTPGTTTGSQTAAQGTPLNWLMILLASGGVAILSVGAWIIFGERITAGRKAAQKAKPTPAVIRPRPIRQSAEAASEPGLDLDTAEAPPSTFVQFCHQCGQKSDPNDRFCRSCGTRLKK
jgi:hypothetical protein